MEEEVPSSFRVSERPDLEQNVEEPPHSPIVPEDITDIINKPQIKNTINIIQKKMSSIPITVIYIGFKVAVLVWALFAGLFGIKTFGWSLTLLLNFVDFWFTKNIAAKQIVGIHYMCHDESNGDHTWIFNTISDFDASVGAKRTFWFILILSAIIQAFYLLVSIIRLSFGWTYINFMALSLSIFNIYGLYRCDNSIKLLIKRKIADAASNLNVDEQIPSKEVAP